MIERTLSLRLLTWFLVLLLPAVSCQALAEPTPTLTPTSSAVTAEPPAGEDDATVIPGPTAGATETPEAEETERPTATRPVPPTRTPGGPEPTVDVPPTSVVTGTVPFASPTAAVTLTPGGQEFPPLTMVYSIRWEIAPDNPEVAIATVTVTAEGGNGEYTYFHDDVQQPGPVFTFEWAACTSKPGSIRVASGDGQSLTLDYVEQAPCPATFTPTP